MKPDRQRLLHTFLDLVKVPSPSRNERACADAIRARLEAMGYTVEEDGAAAEVGGNCGNLFVHVPATAPRPAIFLAAHIDTVESGEPPIRPILQGASIHSDGTSILGADDKTGVAALLEMLTILHDEDLPHGELVVAFTVAEELELLGALAMDPQRYAHCDMGIVLDHAAPTDILLGAPTKMALRILVNGIGGHGAFPERRINAAHVLARAVGRLPSRRLDTHSTANLGILRSGTAINIIPDTAYAEYELRSHRDDLLNHHLAQTLLHIEESVREARIRVDHSLTAEGGGLGDDPVAATEIRAATVDIDVCTCYRHYRHAENAVPVKRLQQAIKATGELPHLVVAQGGSDANALNARGLPTVVVGCGMHGAHSVRERADLDEMAHCVEILMHAITAE